MLFVVKMAVHFGSVSRLALFTPRHLYHAHPVLYHDQLLYGPVIASQGEYGVHFPSGLLLGCSSLPARGNRLRSMERLRKCNSKSHHRGVSGRVNFRQEENGQFRLWRRVHSCSCSRDHTDLIVKFFLELSYCHWAVV